MYLNMGARAAFTGQNSRKDNGIFPITFERITIFLHSAVYGDTSRYNT